MITKIELSNLKTFNIKSVQSIPNFGADITEIKKTSLDVDRYQSTMKIDQAAVSSAISQIESAENSPFKNNIFLDLGSNNGSLSRELRRLKPNLKTINLEVSEKMNKISKAIDKKEGLTANVRYLTGNAFKMPIRDNSVDTIMCNRVIHEIFSYESKEHNEKKFSKESVKHLFEEMHKKLRFAGVFIIIDCARPQNPDEICTLINIKKDKKLTDEEVLKADVRGLDTFNLLKRFCLEFEPAQGNYKFEGEDCKMPKWLLAEFIRHRKFNDTPWHWADEINEQYCALSLKDYAEMADVAGFENGGGTIIFTGRDNNFYGVKDEEFEALDSTGLKMQLDTEIPVHQEMRFIKKMDF